MSDSKTRTSRAPFIVDGVEWLSFRVGINQYALYSADSRGIVKRNYNRSTYKAIVSGVTIGERFRSDTSACKAAAKRLKEVKQ